jgi:cold shock CspA family protein/ribosome-associated translation inhibitor RaiA
MQRPPVITCRHIDPSPAVETLIARRIARLERISGRIVGCEVTLEAPQKPRRKGRVFQVRVALHTGGPDLTAARAVAQGSARDDLLLAMNRAFSAAELRLKRQKKVMGGVEVKHHPPYVQGEVVQIEPELGWGTLRTEDGREVYFQRDALTGADWDALAPGIRLRFREMEGEKGAYAAAVARVA